MIKGVKVEGFAEAVALMKHLPNAVQKRTLERIFRDASKPIVAAAKSYVSGNSKRVARSIKAWAPRGKTDPVFFVGPKFSKNADADPWFAHMIEGGAKGIKKSQGSKRLPHSTEKHLIFIRKSLKTAKNSFRYRANQPAKPFMEPAIEQNREMVSQRFTSELNTLIQNEINKSK